MLTVEAIRTPQTASRRQRPGFSLVEMVLVTAVIGILAVVAVPRYAGFLAEQRVEAAARRLETDLAFAQRQARFQGASRTVDFTVSTHSYELLDVSHPDHPGQPYRVSLADEPYGATIVSADFGGSTSLTFDGFGTPVQTGNVIVSVGTRQRTVTIDPAQLVLRPRRKPTEIELQ